MLIQVPTMSLRSTIATHYTAAVNLPRQRRSSLASVDDDHTEMFTYREPMSVTIANPPKTATAAASSAIDRSCPLWTATSQLGV